jgi:hypothetical protein
MSDLFYNVVAVIIFAFVAINFLFPCNIVIPLGKMHCLCSVVLLELPLNE